MVLVVADLLTTMSTKTEICVRIFVSCVYYLCVLFAFRDLHFGKDHILHSGRKMFDDFDARGERGKSCILFPNDSFFTLIQRITIDKHSNTLLFLFLFFLSRICLFPLKVLESSNDESPHSDDEVPMMTRRRRPRRARKRAIAASEEETG